MKTKLPFIQIYPSDHFADTKMLSCAARGFWMDCVLTMWTAPKRGELDFLLPGYAGMSSCSLDEVVDLITEVVAYGVGDLQISVDSLSEDQRQALGLPVEVLETLVTTSRVESAHVELVLRAIAAHGLRSVRVQLICRRMRREQIEREKNRERVRKCRGKKSEKSPIENDVPAEELPIAIPKPQELTELKRSTNQQPIDLSEAKPVAADSAPVLNGTTVSYSEKSAYVEASEKILDHWNRHPVLPKCDHLSDDRLYKLKVRLRDPWWRDHVLQAVDRIAKIPFCNGTGGRGWQATFDWLLEESSVPKIIEGRYDNTPKSIDTIIRCKVNGL